jgi:hypothetical protein
MLLGRLPPSISIIGRREARVVDRGKYFALDDISNISTG